MKTDNVLPTDSAFWNVLEEFFDGMESDATPTDTTRKSRSGRRARPRAERKGDSLLDTLIRLLTKKDPIKPAEVAATFERTVSRGQELVKSELFAFYFMGEKGRFATREPLRLAYAFPMRSLFQGRPDEAARFLDRIEHLKPKRVEGVILRALEKRVPILVHALDVPEESIRELGAAAGLDARALLAVPVMDGDAFGVIVALNKERGSGEEFFSTQDQKLLEELGRYAARLIRRSLDPRLETTDADMARYVAHLARTEAIDLTTTVLDEGLFSAIGLETIQKYAIVPVKPLKGKSIAVAMDNPLDAQRRRHFELATDRVLGEVFAATPAQIREVVASRSPRLVERRPTDVLLEQVANKVQKPVVEVTPVSLDDGPVVQLANHIIEEAHARGASDIHVEPLENEVRIRFRVDGNLAELMRLPKPALEPLVARYKIMAPPMKIDEKRLPQDGKIKFKNFSSSDIDLRVATTPSAWGEKCVLRILAKASIALGLEKMGFSAANLEAVRWAVRQPYGMVLCCGPTGSGKTTTLYAALSEINSEDLNIQTAEDPIEYPLPGITQLQVHRSIGLSFAKALRAFMRQDPDVILVGEIRDRITAKTAIEASLTGHLLLSTLHTNDAATTVTRFVEMGVPPFLVASSLLLISAQRLARRLCDCKIPGKPTSEELELLQGDVVKLFRAREGGCPRCAGTGYKGRIGIHEILSLRDEMGPAIRELVHKRVSSETIKKQAVELGMRTLWEDALDKVREGVTDLREVATVVRAEKPRPAPRKAPSRSRGRKK